MIIETKNIKKIAIDNIRRLEAIKKSQFVRALDVAVLGPAMIYSAVDKTPPKALRNLILLVGIGTIIYNGANYLKIKAEQERITRETQKKQPDS